MNSIIHTTQKAQFPEKQKYFCFVCRGPGSTRHHFVPVHSQKKEIGYVLDARTVRACQKCHSDIHYYFSHWELKKELWTAETLKKELLLRKESDNPLFLTEVVLNY